MPPIQSKPRVLQLNLAQPWFDQIANGKKRTEYREAKPYWAQRLEGRTYDLIEFRNGYAPDAPACWWSSGASPGKAKAPAHNTLSASAKSSSPQPAPARPWPVPWPNAPKSKIVNRKS